MKKRLQSPGHALLFIALILAGWSFLKMLVCSLAPKIHSTVWGTIIVIVEINTEGCILVQWIMSFLPFFYLIMDGGKLLSPAFPHKLKNASHEVVD